MIACFLFSEIELPVNQINAERKKKKKKKKRPGRIFFFLFSFSPGSWWMIRYGYGSMSHLFETTIFLNPTPSFDMIVVGKGAELWRTCQFLRLVGLVTSGRPVLYEYRYGTGSVLYRRYFYVVKLLT